MYIPITKKVIINGYKIEGWRKTQETFYLHVLKCVCIYLSHVHLIHYNFKFHKSLIYFKYDRVMTVFVLAKILFYRFCFTILVKFVRFYHSFPSQNVDGLTIKSHLL